MKYHSTEEETLQKDSSSAVHLQAGLSAIPCWLGPQCAHSKMKGDALNCRKMLHALMCLFLSFPASPSKLLTGGIFLNYSVRPVWPSTWVSLGDTAGQPCTLDLIQTHSFKSCNMQASPALISGSCSFQMDWNGYFELFHFPKTNWEPYVYIWSWNWDTCVGSNKTTFLKIWPPGFSRIQLNWSWIVECQWIMCQKSLCTECVINRLYT